MKKIILLLLVCVMLITTGCSYGEVGLVQNADGSVMEYYYIPFPEQEFLENGLNTIELNDILTNIKNDYENNNGIIAQLINDYQKRITNSNYTIEQKRNFINGVKYEFKTIKDANDYCIGIQYIFNFANSNCYLEFKNANAYIKEDKVTEEINYFFTTVTKVVKDPLFDKISNDSLTIGQNCLKQVEKHMINVLGDFSWTVLKNELNYGKYASKFNYSYIVPTARVHSNATEITKKPNGYYYHTWQVDLNNLDINNEPIIKIEYWTVSANRAVWYVITLLLAGIIICSVYIYGRKRENNQLNEFKKEL